MDLEIEKIFSKLLCENISFPEININMSIKMLPLGLNELKNFS